MRRAKGAFHNKRLLTKQIGLPSSILCFTNASKPIPPRPVSSFLYTRSTVEGLPIQINAQLTHNKPAHDNISPISSFDNKLTQFISLPSSASQTSTVRSKTHLRRMERTQVQDKFTTKANNTNGCETMNKKRKIQDCERKLQDKFYERKRTLR